MLAIHSFFSDEVEITLGEDGLSVSSLFVNPNNVVCFAQNYDGELIVIQLSTGVNVYISNFDNEEYQSLKSSF